MVKREFWNCKTELGRITFISVLPFFPGKGYFHFGMALPEKVISVHFGRVCGEERSEVALVFIVLVLRIVATRETQFRVPRPQDGRMIFSRVRRRLSAASFFSSKPGNRALLRFHCAARPRTLD